MAMRYNNSVMTQTLVYFLGDLETRFLLLWKRIDSYRPYEVLIELALLWIVIYVIFRFLRGTHGARVMKGLALVLIIVTLTSRVLVGEDAFERLDLLYKNFLGFIALALVIVFQPELRRGLVRLGEARFFRAGGLRRARVIEEVVAAVDYMSKHKIGALIAMEGQVGLDGIIESGTRMEATVSRELLNTIFWPGSALHDMGMVIRGDRIVAAGVQFPLAEGEFDAELGSRHRAAIGLSQGADTLVIVVSEETGKVSVAERGRLTRDLTLNALRTLLVRSLGRAEAGASEPQLVGHERDEVT